MAVQKSRKTLSKKKIRWFSKSNNLSKARAYRKYYYGKFNITSLMCI